VYERNARPGGLLRYGIPDFKMEKEIIDRRIRQMEAEGVVFHCGTEIGAARATSAVLDGCDALLLASGSEQPFDMFAKAPGRELDGLHFAMHFLPQQNRRVSGEPIGDAREISAAGKHVIVIGGGDTGSDCIGTAFRQGAKSVTQLEIMPMPPAREEKALSWPHWPVKLRTSTSQAEGAQVAYSMATTGFAGSGGRVEKLLYAHVDAALRPVPGSEGELPADLVLFAMGFSGPIEAGPIAELGLGLVARGRFKGVDADERDYRVAGAPRVFAAGDIRRGQSLVVWAIREGRQAAHAIDRFLMGRSDLPR
jgi:glutamate synthase (NADPH/NADH) small chain